MHAVLHFALSEDISYLQASIKDHGLEAKDWNVHEILLAHGVAFQRRLLPVEPERLEKIMMGPLLKLAQLSSSQRGAPARVEKFRRELLLDFLNGISGLLDFAYAFKTDKRKIEIKQVLQSKKRAELVKVLMEAKFPEVRYKPITANSFRRPFYLRE